MTSPEQISLGVEELLLQAKRLGLTPVYRLGTVLATTGADVSGIMVTLDNDILPSRCYNFAGPLVAGDRVLTITVKPQGVYVIGNASGRPNPAVGFINQAAAVDTTTSAAYADLAGSISLSFTKFRADTFLEVDMRASSFITGVTNTRPSFAALINGTDYEIMTMLINPVSTHTWMSGCELIPSIPAGTYTIKGRWARAAGTGTCARAAGDDWITLKVRETF